MSKQFSNNSTGPFPRRFEMEETNYLLARFLHLDIPLLVGLCLLAGVGLVVLYSAGGQDSNLVARQLLRLTLGFAAMGLFAQIPPQHLDRAAPWLYAAGVVLLVGVLLKGDIGKGARRWLDLGMVRFQPSEVMKVAMPMAIAWLLANSTLPPRLWRLALAAVMILLPVALIAKQPDLGTALLVASAGAFTLFLGGIPWWLMGILTASFIALAPVAWHFLHDYQRARVMMFLNPESDPLGAGYHIIQSKIALGSGGVYGKGWINGTQAHLDFIPERSTDFIFAVFGEEFGLMGAILLMILYLFVIARGLYIAAQAQGTFARLLAGSITLTFFVYIFVNLGMVSGLLPVVGIPLPLISYGGTSLVTLMAAFGILMSIGTHRRPIG
ncbi:SEDS family protein MrdB [Gammaproteobacteria bacterium]